MRFSYVVKLFVIPTWEKNAVVFLICKDINDTVAPFLMRYTPAGNCAAAR